MTFRIRLLLIFTAAVIASVGVVEWSVTDKTREAFEAQDKQRVDVLVQQFRNEYDRRKQEIVLAVKRIADSRLASDIAASPRPEDYSQEAERLASTNGLDCLELVADDGSIVSSAEWPARYSYKEEWLTAGKDWQALGAFLKPEELQDGWTLSLLSVETASAVDSKLYVVGG